MSIVISVFERSPDAGRGLARDMPVRWALEEAGLTYAVRTVAMDALQSAEHLERQPFGQIPAFEEDGLRLFESGAIVLHIAHRSAALLPEEPQARARAVSWMFAAVSTLEPPIVAASLAVMLEQNLPGHIERLALLRERVDVRLAGLERRLARRDWLEAEFSAGDLMTICVLRRLSITGRLADFPILAAYVSRGEARPAFQRAFAAQKSLFEASAPQN